MLKAKALKPHYFGYYDKGDVVKVRNDKYEGTYKVEVEKNGQVIARTTEPRRYFEIIEEE